MWEGWEDIESHSHAWNGYPARLLQEYVAGIQPAEPGFARVRIKPYLAPGLTYAEASVPTIRGKVRVRWERLNKGIRLIADIPPAMTAEIEWDAEADGGLDSIRESEGMVWEEGRFTAGVPGILSCDKRGEQMMLKVDSGQYEFIIE
ncbi:alpha-L-rhamnosidase, partial [Paenibacillus sepulcri]|nr:alpha-L-rhamnosidase [Paenibacillus sepulcri]